MTKRVLSEYQFRTHPIGSNPVSPHSFPDVWRTDIIERGPVRHTQLPQGGRRVGFLEWDKTDNGSSEIWNIEVDPAHQRKGLATEALRHSQRVAQASRGVIPVPRHSENRTPEGDLWARSTGDPFPKNKWQGYTPQYED